MRLPVDRRSIAEASILSAEVDAFAARIAPMLVLITAMIYSRDCPEMGGTVRLIRRGCQMQERRNRAMFKGAARQTRSVTDYY